MKTRNSFRPLFFAVPGFVLCVIFLVNIPTLAALGYVVFHKSDYHETVFSVESEQIGRGPSKTRYRFYEGVVNGRREALSRKSAGSALQVGESVPVRYSDVATSMMLNGYTLRVVSEKVFLTATVGNLLMGAIVLCLSAYLGVYLLKRANQIFRCST